MRRPRSVNSCRRCKPCRYTVTELMNLTRAELFALHRQTVDALALLPEGSPERVTALVTLRYIRRVLARREYIPE